MAPEVESSSPERIRQEGGFSRSVGANDAVAVPGGKLQVDPLEQPLAAKLHAKVVDCNHDMGVPFSWDVLESVIEGGKRGLPLAAAKGQGPV